MNSVEPRLDIKSLRNRRGKSKWVILGTTICLHILVLGDFCTNWIYCKINRTIHFWLTRSYFSNSTNIPAVLITLYLEVIYT